MDESEGPTGKMIVDGIKVDYSSLSRELKENQGEEVDFEFIESLKEISSEIEKLVPNMKAIDKYIYIMDEDDLFFVGLMMLRIN